MKHKKKETKRCWMCENCSVLPPFVCFVFNTDIKEDEMEQAENCPVFDPTLEISQSVEEE
jgi:hypothetical protein